MCEADSNYLHSKFNRDAQKQTRTKYLINRKPLTERLVYDSYRETIREKKKLYFVIKNCEYWIINYYIFESDIENQIRSRVLLHTGCFISFEARQDDYFSTSRTVSNQYIFISVWSTRHGLSNDILLINILFCISKNISIRM